MKTRGNKVVYKEVPGGRHLSSFIQDFEDQILDFFDAATPASKTPQVD